MKSTIILSFALVLSIIGCQNQPTEIRTSSEQISFSTDSSSYVESDTINLSLKNGPSFDLIVYLKCGRFLEMFYQKKVNQDWSDTLWFSYMSLKCLTFSDTGTEEQLICVFNASKNARFDRDVSFINRRLYSTKRYFFNGNFESVSDSIAKYRVRGSVNFNNHKRMKIACCLTSRSS